MNTFTDTCPSLEDLAAFLDGKLSGDERARVVAHLADCPRCYEVFAETARFQLYEEEEEDADPPEIVDVPQELVAAVAAEARNTVVPFRRTQVFRWVSSIAAVLAVSLAAIPPYRQYYTMPEMRSAQLVNQAVAEKATQDGFWEDFAVRGAPGVVAGLASSPHEVLLGAHALDLRLSLDRNDREGALNVLAGIKVHIDEIGFLPDQAKAYADIQKQIADGQPPRNFIQKAEQTEASLPVEDDPYFAFGKWLEAGRLSSLAEDPDFFQAPENRKFPRAFLHQERENLDSEVVEPLESIQKIPSKADPSSLPYKDLQGLFEKILTYYQRQSK
jgi:hypothetical protein